MTGHDTPIHLLTNLPPAQRDAELRRVLGDSLQELVACIERSLPLGGNTLHSCVVDDFDIQGSELHQHDCRVTVQFNGSARQGVGSAARLERLTGCAEAVLDEQGAVTYSDVRFTKEAAVVAPDIGGGD
jgi:hypothetical protein